MTRSVLIGLFGAAVLAGCATTHEADVAVEVEREPVKREVAPGPIVPKAETAIAKPAEGPAAVAEAADDPRDSVKRRADDLLMREDGRPSWWFGEVEMGGDRARLCAEALGKDMLSAKRAAVSAAKERLKRELGVGTLVGDEVERAWVWPLPHRETPGARYAGYVLVSVARAE